MMSQAPGSERKRLLDPAERVSEVLFGTIMVLTFTGSLSAAEADRAEIRTMLIGALGCNIAWGIVDAVMFLMNIFTERARGLNIFRAVRSAAEPATAHGIISDALPPIVSQILHDTEIESIRKRLTDLPEPKHPRIRGKDWAAALGIFLLVFLSTFPVVVPFLFMTDVYRALRTSNLIAIGMLFLCGYSLGKYAGSGALRNGLAMVLVGIVLVAITIALGG